MAATTVISSVFTPRNFGARQMGNVDLKFRVGLHKNTGQPQWQARTKLGGRECLFVQDFRSDFTSVQAEVLYRRCLITRMVGQGVYAVSLGQPEEIVTPHLAKTVGQQQAAEFSKAVNPVPEKVGGRKVSATERELIAAMRGEF